MISSVTLIPWRLLLDMETAILHCGGYMVLFPDQNVSNCFVYLITSGCLFLPILVLVGKKKQGIDKGYERDKRLDLRNKAGLEKLFRNIVEPVNLNSQEAPNRCRARRQVKWIIYTISHMIYLKMEEDKEGSKTIEDLSLSINQISILYSFLNLWVSYFIHCCTKASYL